MPDAAIDIDVLVVGAGPVELFLVGEAPPSRSRARLRSGGFRS